jgi:hypothetical protein
VDQLLGGLLPVIGAALGTALIALVGMMLRKYGIQLSAEKQGKLEHFVQLGIQYAEEYARNVLKQRGVIVTAEQKQQVASAFVNENVKNVAADVLTKLIDAKMPAARVLSSAATAATKAAEAPDAVVVPVVAVTADPKG